MGTRPSIGILGSPASPILRSAGCLLLISAITVSAWRERAMAQVADQVDRVIVGAVVDADSGVGISGAVVTLRPAKGPASSVQTSASGQFIFQRVSAGSYSLPVTHGEYVRGYFGDRFAQDDSIRTLEVRDDERVTTIRLRLWKWATVSGRVTDEANEPVVGAPVAAFQQTFIGGRPRLVPRKPVLTDDRGEYRISTLPPGRYVVGVSARAQTPRQMAYVASYYPSTPNVSLAEILTLAGGEERAGIALRLNSTAAFKLSGKIAGLAANTDPVQVSLVRLDSTPGSEMPTASALAKAPDFGFLFDAVPSGDYRLRFVSFRRLTEKDFDPRTAHPIQRTTGNVAQRLGPDGQIMPFPPVPAGETWWADQPVRVAKDLAEVRLQAQEGLTIAGRVTYDAAVVPLSELDLNRTAVMVMTADGVDIGPFPVARVEADGQFRTAGFPPGRYAVFLLPGSSWGRRTARAAMLGGIDIWGGSLDLVDRNVTGLEIPVTDTLTALSGTVESPPGVDVQDLTVYVFPVDRKLWVDFGAIPLRFRAVRPSRTGQYSVTVPPGEYFVVATTAARSSWAEPEWLGRLSGVAERVRLNNGDQTTRGLAVRPVK